MQIQTQTSDLFIVKTPCRAPRKQAALAAFCDFQLCKGISVHSYSSKLIKCSSRFKQSILAFCLAVVLAEVLVKVTAKLLPWGLYLYLPAPVGFVLLYHILTRAGVQPSAQHRQVCESGCLLLKLCLHLFTKEI